MTTPNLDQPVTVAEWAAALQRERERCNTALLFAMRPPADLTEYRTDPPEPVVLVEDICSEVERDALADQLEALRKLVLQAQAALMAPAPLPVQVQAVDRFVDFLRIVDQTRGRWERALREDAKDRKVEEQRMRDQQARAEARKGAA